MFRAPFPILYVADVERSARFYEDCFDFAPRYRYPAAGGGEASFVVLRLEEGTIGLASLEAAESGHGEPVGRGPVSLELCFYADDVDAAAERLRAAGARELRPPETMPWGEVRCYFADPDGNPLQICASVS